jgi:hypothetical protein
MEELDSRSELRLSGGIFWLGERSAILRFILPIVARVSQKGVSELRSLEDAFTVRRCSRPCRWH